MRFFNYLHKLDFLSKYFLPSTPAETSLLPALAISPEAEYSRTGNDLVIHIGQDSMVLQNYFRHPQELVAEGGTRLSFQDVINLVNHSPPPILVAAQEAVGVQAKLEKIGAVTATVEGPITAQDIQGKTRTLQSGDPIYLHDTIVTVARSYVKLTLQDGTVLQLGPLSRCSLDKYHYDPQSASPGQFETNIFSGLFRYLSGKISGDNQGQHTVITTPSANIGIRGSELDAQVGEDGSTNVLHLQGLISVYSRHRPAEEIVVYERGTTIYIPNDNRSVTFTQATEVQIQQREEQWQVFNVTSTQEEVSLQAKAVEAGQPVSISEDNDSPPLPDMGAHSPFLPGEDQRPLIKQELTESEDPSAAANWQGTLGRSTVEWGMAMNESEETIEDDNVTASATNPDGLSEAMMDQGNDVSIEDNETLPVVTTPAVPDVPNGSGTPITPTVPTTPASPATPTTPTQPILLTLSVNEDSAMVVSVPHEKLMQPTLPSHGNVSEKPDGALIYTPFANFFGEDKFSCITAQGKEVEVTMTVAAVNDIPVVKADVATLPEDTTLILSGQEVLVNDTDVDVGDTLSIVSVSPLFLTDSQGIQRDLTHGEVRLDHGNIVYSPAANFNGPDPFIYVVQDGQGARNTGQVVVTVTPVNDAPIAETDVVTFDNNRVAWTIPADTLLANDEDVDQDPLRIVNLLNSENGQASLDSSGNVQFTPVQNFQNGGFDYVISDGNLTSTGRVNLSSTDINSAPVARDDTIQTSSSATTQPFTLSPGELLVNDSDPDGDPLSISFLFDHINGRASFDKQGNIQWTAVTGATEGGFVYQISDGQGHTATATVTITINVINQPPIAQNDTFSTSQMGVFTLFQNQLLANDTDPDGDSLSLANLGNAVNGTVTLDRHGNIVWIGDANFSTQKTGSFTYDIQDGNGHTATASVTLTLINQPPAAEDDTLIVNGSQATTITSDQLLKNDTDPEGDRLTIIEVTNGLHGNVHLDDQGQPIFTPNADFAESEKGSFTYTVVDSSGNSDTATVTLQPSPRLTQDDALETSQVTPVTITPQSLLANDTPTKDPLTITHLTDAINGAVNWDDQGNIQFTPSAEFVKQQFGQFTYEVVDGNGYTGTATVTLTLTNHSPLAHDDGPIDIGEATAFTIPAATLLQNDYDEDQDALTLTLVPNTNQQGMVVFDENGNVVFTRDSTFAGTASFSYEISDGKGGVDQAQVTLVGQVNHSPVAESDQAQTTKNQPIEIALLTNDHDPDAIDSLVISELSAPLHGTVTLTDKPGVVLFTPEDQFTGETTFSYTITDKHGMTDTAEVKITVTNTPPLAANDWLTTVTNQPVTLATTELLQNDTDADPGDVEKLQVIKVEQAVNGTVTLANGEIVFTPNPDFQGEASFVYTMVDPSGTSANATVTINVIGQLQAQADSFTTFQNTDLTLSRDDLLANDTKVNLGDILTLATLENATHGQVQQDVQGSIIFTPEPEFVGEASFQYTVMDTQGHSDQTTVTVLVTERPLIAQNDTVTTPANVALTIPVTDLLENDKGEGLTLTTVDQATSGKVELNDNQVTFTPTADFEGEASFAYTIQDHNGLEDTATVTVMVTPLNEPPVVTLPSSNTPLIYQLGEEAQLVDPQASVSDSDSPDFDGGTLQVTLTNATHADLLEIQNRGSITVSSTSGGGNVFYNGTSIGNFSLLLATGALTISLNANANAESVSSLLQSITYRNTLATATADVHTVEVTLTDGDGGTSVVASREIQIVVTSLQAESDEISIPFNSPVTLSTMDLLSNDTAASPTEVLQITAINAHPDAGVNATLVGEEVQLFIDGLVNDNFDSMTFDYTITDGQGSEDTTTVTLTPTNVVNGTPNDDSLSSATPQLDILQGLEGNDTFTLTQGPDILLGGPGEDQFLLDPANAAGVSIRGGPDLDTLSFSGQDGQTLDLIKNQELSPSQKLDLQGIDVIDLTSKSSSGNQLKLGLQDVLDISDQGQLIIEGDATSVVRSTGQSWTNQGIDESGLYYHYTASNGAELLVSTDIAFQLVS